MVTKKTKAEIFDNFDDLHKSAVETEYCIPLYTFDDDDEFYTNGEHYIEVEQVERLMSYIAGIAMLDEYDLWDEYLQWAGVKQLLRDKQTITADEMETKLFSYLADDMEFYLEFLWEKYEN